MPHLQVVVSRKNRTKVTTALDLNLLFYTLKTIVAPRDLGEHKRVCCQAKTAKTGELNQPEGMLREWV